MKSAFHTDAYGLCNNPFSEAVIAPNMVINFIRQERLIACALVLAGLIGSAVCSARQPEESPALEFESLSVTALGGKPFAAGAWLEHPVLIQFWASWCGSCGSIMWDMDELLEQFPRVSYLAVSTDEQSGPAREYVGKHALFARRADSFVHDTGGRMARRFEVATVPTILVADRTGAIVHRHLGHLNSAEIQAIRTSLLKLPRVAVLDAADSVQGGRP